MTSKSSFLLVSPDSAGTVSPGHGDGHGSLDHQHGSMHLYTSGGGSSPQSTSVSVAAIASSESIPPPPPPPISHPAAAAAAASSTSSSASSSHLHHSHSHHFHYEHPAYTHHHHHHHHFHQPYSTPSVSVASFRHQTNIIGNESLDYDTNSNDNNNDHGDNDILLESTRKSLSKSSLIMMESQSSSSSSSRKPEMPMIGPMILNRKCAPPPLTLLDVSSGGSGGIIVGDHSGGSTISDIDDAQSNLTGNDNDFRPLLQQSNPNTDTSANTTSSPNIISDQSDTPVPTPPPPPNSFKLSLNTSTATTSSSIHHHHHHHYPYDDEPDEDDAEEEDDDHPHHHHHHHHTCLIHQTQSTSSPTHHHHHQPMTLPIQTSHSGRGKRKRRHRESKRLNRFKFSFRSATGVGGKITSSEPSVVLPPPSPQHQHHHYHVCGSSGTGNSLIDDHGHMTIRPDHPSTPTRASSITSSTSDQDLIDSVTSCQLKQQQQQQQQSQHPQQQNFGQQQQTSALGQDGGGGGGQTPVGIIGSIWNRIQQKKRMNKANGGLKSKKFKTLIHPLDRSIVGIFMLTIFFTILALLTGAPTVLFLLMLLPIFIFLKKLFQCECLFFCTCPSWLSIFSSSSFTSSSSSSAAAAAAAVSGPNSSASGPNSSSSAAASSSASTQSHHYHSSRRDHEPVSSVDSYWLQKGHITHCLMYLDKGLSCQQLKDVIATRLLTKPELARFRSRLIHKGLCRVPYWKYDHSNDNINSLIDDHVIEDEPIESKRSLRRRLISLMSQTLPMDKPLWQIRYSQITFSDQVLLIIRVHQTLSQSGLVSILTHYLCDSVPVCSAQKPRFGSATMSINILRAIIVGPLTFFLWILWAFTRRHHNYLTKSKEIKSIHWSSLDLPKIYRIKQVTRSTLNDVLMASIAGSIRAYLTSKTNIMNPPDLTVSIPVDIKPNTPIESSLIGVNYVLTSSPIPTNTEGAIPRLWEVRHLMEELKTSADTAVMYGSHYLLSRFLPTSLYRLLMNLVNRNSSVYMSNMNGPEQSLSIGSHRLNKIYYFLSPPSYCSIVYNIFTYDQKLYISIVTHSKLIYNAKELMRQFRIQIDTLHELLSKRRVPGESKRIKRPIYLGDQLMAAHHQLIMNAQQQQQQQQQAQQAQQESQQAQLTVDTGGAISPMSGDMTDKLHDIQDELNRLSGAYEMGDPSVVQRYEELKDEFTSILYEMRRRKSLADYHGITAAGNIVINIENQDIDDDIDGELRQLPPRRFSVVSIGHRRPSIVSTLPTSTRVTPPILSRRSMATSPEPPSSPEVAFKVETEC